MSLTSTKALSLFPRSTMAATRQAECALLRFPPELLNNIYHLALTTDSTSRWPGLTGACKEIRAATLPIWLGNNDFTLKIGDLDDTKCLQWLSLVHELPAEVRCFLKSINVNCEGAILAKAPEVSISPFIPDPRYLPNLDFWDNLIRQLKAIDAEPSLNLWPDPPAPQREGLQSFEPVIFYKYILLPLLERHGMHGGSTDSDFARLMENYLQDVRQMYLGLVTVEDLWQSLADLVVGDPEKWYAEWCYKTGRSRRRVRASDGAR